MRTGALRAACCLAAFLALVTGGTARAGEAPPFDPRVTSIAQLLAGIEPDYALHRRLATLDAWQTHRRALAPQWKMLRSGRLDAIEAWRDEVLVADLLKCRTLLYPFSGPDFLNAYLLFPRCDTYVFIGLEPPGTLPELDRMGNPEVGKTLQEMRTALQDVLAHNFFMTKHMAQQLDTPRIDGVLPLLVASMGLIRTRIMAIEPFAPPGARADRKPIIKGVKVTFFHPDIGRPQSLVYLSADASNAGFEQAPEFGAYLASLNPAMVLIKSGSYLLHRPYFSRLRDAVLSVAALVVQDDTGVPYRILRERGWTVRLYGDYTSPIPLFANDLQADLAAAYLTRVDGKRLTFAFGYKGARGESNAMVARTGNR